MSKEIIKKTFEGEGDEAVMFARPNLFCHFANGALGLCLTVYSVLVLFTVYCLLCSDVWEVMNSTFKYE